MNDTELYTIAKVIFVCEDTAYKVTTFEVAVRLPIFLFEKSDFPQLVLEGIQQIRPSTLTVEGDNLITFSIQ